MADSGWCMFFIHSFPPSTKTILAAIQLVVWLLKVVNNIFVLGGILIGFDIKSGRIHQRLWFRLYIRALTYGSPIFLNYPFMIY